MGYLCGIFEILRKAIESAQGQYRLDELPLTGQALECSDSSPISTSIYLSLNRRRPRV
jgi:hypothetical protein